MTEPPPHHEKRRWDAWLAPEWELFVGCVLLVFSGWWWFDSRGGVWEGWKNILSTVTVFLGPYLVHRAWTRKIEHERQLLINLVNYHTARHREGFDPIDHIDPD